MFPNRMKLIQTILSIALVAALAACAVPNQPTEPAQPTNPPAEPKPIEPAVLQSDKPRIQDPVVDEGNIAELTAGQAAFAVDLYQQLRTEGGNLFYSPYSILQAFAMAQAGADGDTLEEMNQVLHFTLPFGELHPTFNALDQLLAERAAQVVSEDEPFQLHIANSIWGQQGYDFQPTYLEVLSKNYGAGLQLVDYVADAEGARQAINDWVEEQTEERIQDLIPEGVLNELTRLVIANAIYFNAAWLEPFREDATTQEPFYVIDGEAGEVSMMHRSGSMGYAEGDGWQMVELPYVSNSMVMDVVLPAEGNFAAFEDALTGESLVQMLDQIDYTQVVLSLPKWEFESSFALKQPLTALGMEQAFTPGVADFSGMDNTRDLYIQDALHKAFVSVDEAGTEAAAATALIVGTTSMPLEEKVFTADRPFLFLIRDRESGAILFLGRVMTPTAAN